MEAPAAPQVSIYDPRGGVDFKLKLKKKAEGLQKIFSEYVIQRMQGQDFPKRYFSAASKRLASLEKNPPND